MLSACEENQVQLLGRVAAGDRSALEEFYDQTAAGLFSFACRVLGSSQDAEEVIQDVFVQVWSKAGRFDPLLGLPFNWALGITRNRCIDRLRMRERAARVLVDSPNVADLRAEANAADERPARDEAGAIREAMAGLPKDQRRAIEMAFFGGMTHHEIAAALKEPLGTIKTRIRRGMLKLRDSLSAYYA